MAWVGALLAPGCVGHPGGAGYPPLALTPEVPFSARKALIRALMTGPRGCLRCPGF